jgi:hypothetical protein
VRRNWLVAALVLGIAAIVVAVAAARLTEDDSSEATAWASSVCTSLGEWRTEISSLADVNADDLTAEGLQAKLDEAESATDDLVAELQALGRPDLDAGDEAEEQLDETASELQERYESLKAAVEEALDADSPTAFLQALAALAPEFQALLDQVRQTISSLGSTVGDAADELEQAFEDADSCRELRGDR